MQEYIIKAVNDLVKKYNTRDPIKLAECLGIKIFHYPFHKIKGMVLEFMGRKIIGINSSLPKAEQIIIVGHEIGHDQLSPAGLGYFFMVENTCIITGSEEYRANAFTAELLLAEERPRYGQTIEEFAAELGVPPELVKIKFIK